jgi:uncharacterized membrane protein SirB2
MPLAVRWYRNRPRCLFIYGVLAVVLLGAALQIIGKTGAVWTVLGALAILVAIWLVAGAALAGFGVSQDALIVSSPLGTRHQVPWTQVASFSVSRPGQSERSESVVVAVRTDGRLLHTEGCTFGRGAKGHSRAQAMAAELNSDRLARSDSDVPATLAPRPRASQRSSGKVTPRRCHRRDEFIAWIFFGIVFLSIGAFLIGPSIAAMGPAFRASHDQGVRGSFVAVTEHCGRGCFWSGNFVLPDGTVTLRNVDFNAFTSKMSADQSVKALDTGDPSLVFPTNDSTQWLTQQLVALVLCVVYIVAGLLALAVMARRARRMGMFHRSLVSAAG